MNPSESFKGIFSKSVKPVVIEEIVDYYFFRRVAVYLVPFWVKLRLSPNQVSGVSLLCGLSSAIIFYLGNFFIGALLLLTAVILDCSDGMLARLTGESSALGHMIDSLVDQTWVPCVWFAIWGSGYSRVVGGAFSILMLMAGISFFIHTWTFDRAQNAYLDLCLPDQSEKELNYDEVVDLMQRNWREKKFIYGGLYAMMTALQRIFGRVGEGAEKPEVAEGIRLQASRLLSGPLRLWSFNGLGTYLALIIASGLLTPFYPRAFLCALWIILIVMNVIWIFGAAFWFFRYRKVQKMKMY